MSVEVGEQAPDFELKDQHGSPVRLSSFQGTKNVVLVFYPLAFSGVCSGELCALRDDFPEVEREDVELLTVSVDSTGVVSAVYTNGRSTDLGQLAIANFPNPQGLQQLTDTNWAQTFASGTVVQGTAGSAGFGTVQSSALESSNVDLTTELVNMITEQRAFQANAQVITTADQMSQTVIGIATNG